MRPLSQCIFSVVNITTGGIASLPRSSRVFLAARWLAGGSNRLVGHLVVSLVGAIADSASERRGDAAVLLRAIVHSLSTSRCVLPVQASVGRRTAVAKVTVQGTEFLHPMASLVRVSGTHTCHRCLFCSVLFCSVLFCAVLCCAVLCCFALLCSALFCSLVQYSAV